MNQDFQELTRYLKDFYALKSAMTVLRWDQAVYMPPGGAEHRARQLALLAQLSHQRLIDPQLGRLLDQLEAKQHAVANESNEGSLLREARRLYQVAARIPVHFQQETQIHFSECYQKWAMARTANDFESIKPALEKTLRLSLEYVGFFPESSHPADALIDLEEPGMTTQSIQSLFAALRKSLVPLIQQITSQPVPDNTCLYKHYPESQQMAFGLEVIQQLGFDFHRGRQDKSLHPFTTKFTSGDVRITTRCKENDFGEAFFSAVHEAGHALYHQGMNSLFDGTPLSEIASVGISESQSRLWENIVGRSRSFWHYFYPKLQALFPEQLGLIALEDFYRAINKVQPSLIRTDADEVTYNLHIIMRFEFELQLLEGKLKISDLPEAWRERFKEDFGITPLENKNGVLQDVHWFSGFIGGQFQGYAIGNILSAQFFQAALKAYPQVNEEIANGKFDTLHHWLKENIYQHGSRYIPSDLIRQATGMDLSIEPYIAYLKNKYILEMGAN